MALIKARSMKLAIDTYYESVIRPYKYRDITSDQLVILEEIKGSLFEHFEEFIDK